jgi:hypothetical protein
MNEAMLLAKFGWLSGTGGAILLMLLAILTIRLIFKGHL